MAKPTAPKNNFIQILLIMSLVFLGYQLFMGPQQAASQEKLSPNQIWDKMQSQNARLLDTTITTELRNYERAVNAKAKDENWGKEKLDAEILKGYILKTDTALKSGLYRGQLFKDKKVEQNLAYTKINRAYDMFKPKFETFHKTELWTSLKVPVNPTELRPATEVSADEIYTDLVTTLSPLAKEEPVYGFIPGYQLIDALVNLTGAQPWFSYTFAAFLLALAVRAIIWPLAQKQFIWGRQMQQLSPYVKEIQNKYQKTDKAGKKIPLSQEQQLKMNTEVMDLYKQYGMNPLSGCGPALIQFPFFITIYQCMLHYKFEFTKGFFLWIHPGATSFLGIPLAPNLGERDYILVVIYMISMVTSTLLMPVSDPSNMKQQKLMGVGMAVLFSVFMFFYSLPSAFILYWIFTNVLSTTQSLLAHRIELPPLQKVSSTTGGLIVEDPSVKSNGSANGHIDSSFFGKTGTPKANKAKKKKKK